MKAIKQKVANMALMCIKKWNFGEQFQNINSLILYEALQQQQSISKMDMEKPLKFDGEHFAIETQSDFQHFSEELFFQKQDQIIQSATNGIYTECPINKIIEEIKSVYSIALTPISDLLQIAKQKLEYQCFNEENLKRNLRKNKMIQKRFRAKNRGKANSSSQIIPIRTYDTFTNQKSEDIKKQKNRLSAQISRDRKKQYYSKLEDENQRLRKQLTELSTKNAELQREAKKIAEQPVKSKQNPVKALLILLGIVFMLNMVKNFGGLQAKYKPENYFPKLILNDGEISFVENELSSLGIQFAFNRKQLEVPSNKAMFDKIWEAKSLLH